MIRVLAAWALGLGILIAAATLWEPPAPSPEPVSGAPPVTEPEPELPPADLELRPVDGTPGLRLTR